MSDKVAEKLSREEIANLEIGRTEVSRPVQLVLTGFFLLLIGLYPLVQCLYRSPFTEWRQKDSVRNSIKAYETGIEDTSLLREWLLPPVQTILVRLFSLGNEKVIIGKNGWLFFSGDYDYLINSGFLRPEKLHKRRLAGVQPDPVTAIEDFNRQLRQRGIRLILMPVPSKPVIYPDMLGSRTAGPCQNSSWSGFLQRMKAADIPVIDLAPEFAGMRKLGGEPYLKTDTHWTPEGMKLAARRLVSVLSGKSQPQNLKTIPLTSTGDTAAMLKIPDVNVFFPKETVKLTPVPKNGDRTSDILLLGDSFTNIYSLPAMNWGEHSGLAETLSAELGRPVDVLVRNDAGAYASRQLLALELKRGNDRLRGKKFVVWEFAMRELACGDWKMIRLPEVKVSPNVPAAASKTGTGKILEAVVISASQVPRPHSAPYKDHVMSLCISGKNGEKILVYTIGMKDNVWQAPARLLPGNRIRIRLSPWAQYERIYGGWNRSELDDEELLTAEPVWGELITGKP